MKSNFKLGDRFVHKNTRDMIPLEIYDIRYEFEPIYKLKPIMLCGDDLTLGEAALAELFIKIN